MPKISRSTEIAIRQKLVELDVALFHRLLGAGADDPRPFGTDASETIDAETFDTFRDELDDGTARADDIAALTLVALYHWVERALKRELKHVYLTRGNAYGAEHVDEMAYRKLSTAYRELGIDIEALSNGSAVMRTLRFFVNSWKHNTEDANRELKEDLGFGPGILALFADEDARDALATKVGIEVVDRGKISSAQIAHAFIPLAVGFVKDLLTKTR